MGWGSAHLARTAALGQGQLVQSAWRHAHCSIPAIAERLPVQPATRRYVVFEQEASVERALALNMTEVGPAACAGCACQPATAGCQRGPSAVRPAQRSQAACAPLPGLLPLTQPARVGPNLPPCSLRGTTSAWTERRRRRPRAPWRLTTRARCLWATCRTTARWAPGRCLAGWRLVLWCCKRGPGGPLACHHLGEPSRACFTHHQLRAPVCHPNQELEN